MDQVLAKLACKHPPLMAMLVDYTHSTRDAEKARAKADPHKHRRSRVMTNTNYRYWRAGRDARGREIRFCYSSHRNVAGYFLTWREVVGKKGGKRDQWSARKTRSACKELARRRQNAWIDNANAQQVSV